MKILRIVLFVLHAFIGLGALAGGLGCLLDPMAPMGAPVSMLEGSPFTSFLIPGIVLFVLFGIGNVIGAILSLTKFWGYGAIAGTLGAGMIVWIVVQVVIIDAVTFLHIACFAIGLVQALAGLFLILKNERCLAILLKLLKALKKPLQA
jgi:hypothetical protein